MFTFAVDHPERKTPPIQNGKVYLCRVLVPARANFGDGPVMTQPRVVEAVLQASVSPRGKIFWQFLGTTLVCSLPVQPMKDATHLLQQAFKTCSDIPIPRSWNIKESK